jgi:RNA polymerase sigma-70 factor (ECF subfamily)
VRQEAGWTDADAGLPAALASARLGDPDAFRVLFRALQPRLLRYLHLLVGPEAEDVASETWLQIVRDLRTFDGDADDFRRWAVTIGRHRAFDHLRRGNRRPPRDAVDATHALSARPAHDDTATSAMQNLATSACLGLIGRLSPDQAEAIVLRVVIGLDAASAGRVLGKSPLAVRAAAHRGLRRLAHLMRDGEDMVMTAESGR